MTLCQRQMVNESVECFNGLARDAIAMAELGLFLTFILLGYSLMLIAILYAVTNP